MRELKYPIVAKLKPQGKALDVTAIDGTDLRNKAKAYASRRGMKVAFSKTRTGKVWMQAV